MKKPLPYLLVLLPLWVAAGPGEPVSLFNGRDLTGWKEAGFTAAPEALVEEGILIIPQGEVLAGLVYTNRTPVVDYEVEAEARRLYGSDFFFALTAPHQTNHFTLVCGGWGGAVTGISCIDFMDASENETARVVRYEDERWYKIRLRVEAARLTVWVDDEKLIEADIAGKRIGMRNGEIEKCVPFGLATYQTKGQIRKLILRRLPPVP